MQSRGNQVDSFDQSRVKKSQNWPIRGMETSKSKTPKREAAVLCCTLFHKYVFCYKC